MKPVLTTILALGLVCVVVLLFKYQRSTRQTPIQPALTTVTIGNTMIPVELATTPQEQEHGLSDRTSLPDNSGMLFIFPTDQVRYFWMKDMHFPLDMIWIRDNEILDVIADVPPPASDPTGRLNPLPIYTDNKPVDMILEVNAGFAAAHGIKAGDHVSISTNGTNFR